MIEGSSAISLEQQQAPVDTVQRSVNAPQAFEHNPEFHDNEIGKVTQEILIKWADSLPKVNLPVIDVAAGMGIEASFLEKHGVTTIAQDPSEEYLEKSYVPHNHRIGIAEELPDAAESVRGILCKDSIMFLSPAQREKVFAEAQRVLIPGGSFLLITEYTTAHRAKYVPNNSQYPQTLTSADFGNSYERFVQELDRMKDSNQFFSIQYKCEPSDFIEPAEAVGLTCTKNELHDYKSELAKENRWVQRATLVQIFEKALTAAR